MSVTVSVFVKVSEFGHWVCGESWHATIDLQPTAPVLTAGNPVSYAFVLCLFVSFEVFIVLISFGLLVCSTTYVVYFSLYIETCLYRYLQLFCHTCSVARNSPEQGSLCTVQKYSSSPCVHPYLSSSLAVHIDCMTGDSPGIPPHNGPIENSHVTVLIGNNQWG